MNKLVHRASLYVRRNAPTILTCVGGIGVVATSVMAVKATPKALQLLEEAKAEKGDDLTKLEVVAVAGPAYIPAMVTGAATIACIFGANVLNQRQQASLASAYALIDNSYKEYKKKVEELYGKEANTQVQQEIAKDEYKENDIQQENDELLFYDEFSGRYFNATMERVLVAEYQVNRELHNAGCDTLNHFYELVGLNPIDGGDALGWSEGGNYERYWQSWLDFRHNKVVMDEGLECYIITMFEEPYVEFDDY